MSSTATLTPAHQVKREQAQRAGLVRSRGFLDEHVRHHLPGAPARGGEWATEVIQLDGTGAATVRIQLDGGAPVFAKLFPFDDGPGVHATLRALRDAGFGDGQEHQVVEPLAWYDAERVLLCRGAPGRAVSELVGGDPAALAAASARAGQWLARLHGSGLRIGAQRSLLAAAELTSLAKRLVKVGAEHPAYARPARAMLERLDAVVLDTRDGLVAQSHGQYRPLHVFLADDVVTAIDLDRCGPADPARDVAEFLHRLRLGVHAASGGTAGADPACARFLDAYRESVGADEPLANLRFHWARYVLHSLSGRVRTGEARCEDGGDAQFRFFQAEFERVVDGWTAERGAGA
jgi:hypothetical protein